jgi:uncharacterized membrane protein YphA (DoxX/SURF4 family)
VLGPFARPVAFICAREMAVAYFMGHASQGFWPARNWATRRSCSALSSFAWRSPAAALGASIRRAGERP